MFVKFVKGDSGHVRSGAALRYSHIALKRASLQGAELWGVNLFGMDLEAADLTKADLRGAYLADANLRGATLHETNFQNGVLWGANLHGAVLVGANLQNTDISLVKCEYADLRGALCANSFAIKINLRLADCRGVSFQNADLRCANCHAADFLGATLKSADCTSANFQSACLKGADLRNADLTCAQLQGADLTRAKLENAILKGTILDPQAPIPPLSDEEIMLDGLELRGNRVYGWRTYRSMHQGNTTYLPREEPYVAPVFSVDKSASCHPGIYLCSKEWLMHNYPDEKHVRCYCLRSELVHATNKWRCKRLWVVREEEDHGA